MPNRAKPLRDALYFNFFLDFCFRYGSLEVGRLRLAVQGTRNRERGKGNRQLRNREQAIESSRERTHEDKSFAFKAICHFRRQRTHSAYRYWFQCLAAILGPLSANFEWNGPLYCRFRRAGILPAFGPETRTQKRALGEWPATRIFRGI